MNSQKIAVITDSGTNTDDAFCREHDVRIVPLRIMYSDGSTFESGVDITPNEVVRRFEEEIPTTSLPSPSRIRTILEQAKADGYERAVVVTIASGLSATNQTIHMVAEQLEDFPCIVVDSKSIGMMAGFVVMRAVEAIEAGVPFERLEALLAQVADDTEVFFGVKSLEYLRKGGRINGHIYRIGSVLNIKPVLTCNKKNGTYEMAKKARGWDRALDTMIKLTAEKAKRFERVRLAVCCTSATSELFDELEQRLTYAVSAEVVEVLRHGISADLLVHAGPELVGMGVQRA